MLEELKASAIDPEIIDRNFSTVSPTTDRTVSPAYQILLYAVPDSWYRAGGHRDLKAEHKRKYQHLDHGGWWCSTLEPNGADSDWGCFKPNSPRTVKDGDKEKVIKYETPPCTAAKPFILDIPPSIWGKILENYDMPGDVTRLIREFGNVWQWAKANPQIPIIITEGAKKAASLLSAGYVAIALNGIWGAVRNPIDEVTGDKSGDRHLIPEIEFFCQPGREFIFCFDNDEKEKTRISVNSAIKATGKLMIERTAAPISVMSWRGKLKGIDDYHAKHGADAVGKLFKGRKIRTWSQPSEPEAPVTDYDTTGDRQEKKPEPKTPPVPVEAVTSKPLKPNRPASRRIHGGYKNLAYAELYEYLEEHVGDRLQFDMMRREMLLDGKIFRLADELRPWFFSEFGEVANENDIYKTMVNLAKRNAVDPVVDDLWRCHREAERVRIDNLAARYFGHDWENMPDKTDDEKRDRRIAWMYNRYVEMWLISAVARQFETAEHRDDPTYLGCQVDHVLVLQGGEGKGKSQWFKYLAKLYFNDSITDIMSVNSLMAMHGNWIIELAEIDGITSKKDAAELKKYLTIRKDEFRVPYARQPMKHDRRSVFCGTVNPSRFLIDDGDNRRFWCVPVLKDLDLELLQKERDGIWAAAVDAYLEGKIWYPSAKEKAISREINLEFSELDPWHERVESYLEGLEYANTNAILEHVFGFLPKDIGKREQMRITKILNRMGYTSETRIREGGRYLRVRYNPLKTPNFNKKVGHVGSIPLQQGLQVNQPIDQPQKDPTYPPSPQSDPTSEVNRPNLSEVGQAENPSLQGLQGSVTNQPTKKDFLPQSPSEIPEAEKQHGYKYPLGSIAMHRGSSRCVVLADFAGVGSRRLTREYYCTYLDNDESCYIPQRELVPVS